MRNFEALKAAALAATPGPRYRSSVIFNGVTSEQTFMTQGNKPHIANAGEKRDAIFIAAASPDVVLELLAALEAETERAAAAISELLAVREAQSVGGIRVGNLPTMNQDEYPGLPDWWVQLRIGTDGDEVLARIYGSTPHEAMMRARAIAAPPAPAVPDEVKQVLLWALWHHQGGNSDIGQPIRQFLGIDQYSHLSPAQLDIAKAYPASMAEKRVIRDGYTLVPVESSDEWAERYCELTNKHPDGGLTTYIGDGAVTISFREKSKREIDAMLAAAPTPTNK